MPSQLYVSVFAFLFTKIVLQEQLCQAQGCYQQKHFYLKHFQLFSVFLIRVSSCKLVKLVAYTYCLFFAYKNYNTGAAMPAAGAFSSNIFFIIFTFLIANTRAVAAGVLGQLYVFIFIFCFSAYENYNVRVVMPAKDMITAITFLFNTF